MYKVHLLQSIEKKPAAPVYDGRMFQIVPEQVVLSGIVHNIFKGMACPEAEASYIKPARPAPYLNRGVLCISSKVGR